ncbi:mariner mos1 transposase [Lasius niger]|uniref:Mariner mos1 transposase n=1 Tax=Lasius niger TaxID=67767 RepID=A0A0J7KEJ0_LASNI|nr:mariner mos1 transposase [Lasius niger]
MEIDKMHIRHCMLHYFHWRKTAAEATRIICETYGEGVLAENSCRNWFQRFKSGDFNMNDKPRSGRPQEVQDDDLELLLTEDPSLSAVDLAKVLNVNQSTVNRRLHAMGKIQKEGNWAA